MPDSISGLPEYRISKASDGVFTAITEAHPFVVDVDAPKCAMLIPLSLGRLSVEDKTRGESYSADCPFSMTYLPARTQVRLEQSAAIEHLYITVDNAHLKRLNLNSLCDGIEAGRPVIGYCNPDIPLAAQSLRRHLLAPHYSGPIYIEALTNVLLTHVLAASDQCAHGKANAQHLDESTLQSILIRIDSSLTERISIADLADQAKMPPFTFTRAFKSSTGQSPYQYVLERRINLARGLLTRGELSLAEVAYSSGFASQSHMTDIFRQKLGVTPGKYRREAKKQ